MNSEEVLQKLGLTEKETKVYLALLRVGEAPVVTVAKQADIPRTHCYDILRTLSEKGLVNAILQNGHYRYTAVSPHQVKRIFSNRLQAFEELLPSLETIYQGAVDRPTVRFFVGKDGMKAIHQEFLAEAKELLFYGAGEDWVKSFNDWEDFTRALIRARITIRELVRHLPEMDTYGKLYDGERRQMRFIPDTWAFPSDCAIWDNKVAFLTYGEDMHGVVVESNTISASQRQVFELLWSAAEV